MNQIRHGDVYLFRLPNAKPKAGQKRSPVLAEGELTGHAHRVLEAPGVDVYEWDDFTWEVAPHLREGHEPLFNAAPEALVVVQPGKEGVVTHEEHGEVVLPEGVWAVMIAEEYTGPDLDRRRVLD